VAVGLRVDALDEVPEAEGIHLLLVSRVRVHFPSSVLREKRDGFFPRDTGWPAMPEAPVSGDSLAGRLPFDTSDNICVIISRAMGGVLLSNGSRRQSY